jgi:hypothetical protein
MLNIYSGKYMLENMKFTLEWWWWEGVRKVKIPYMEHVTYESKRENDIFIRAFHPQAQHIDDLSHSNASSSMKTLYNCKIV